MKILLAQPAILRFQWELEVLLTNLRQFGQLENVILLFSEQDNTVPHYLRDKYGVQCFVYRDERKDKSHIPGIRPYLFWRYLKENPEAENESYLFIDSDIIFRQWPDFDKINADKDTWVGANCGGYIDYRYLSTRRNSDQILKKFTEVCGVSIDQIRDTPGAGAQWVIIKPSAYYWERVWQDGLELFKYLSTVDSNIQRWTGFMWAMLYGAVREGKTVKLSTELDFCWPTDALEMWDKKNILHNAGVIDEIKQSLFFKGRYSETTPFDENLDWVRRDKCSIKYVEAIKAVNIRRNLWLN